MERVNFQAIEKNGKKNFLSLSSQNQKEKNFTVWKCFHIPLEKYTWAMSEIIQSVMLSLAINI